MAISPKNANHSDSHCPWLLCTMRSLSMLIMYNQVRMVRVFERKCHVFWSFPSEIARNKLRFPVHKQQLLEFVIEGGAIFGVVIGVAGG